MDLDELIDRESVRHTLAAYNAATDRADLDGVAACFTPDGALQIGDQEPIAADRIAVELPAILAERPSGRPAPTHVHHHVSTTHFRRVEADAIHTDSYFVVFTQIGVDHWGRYRDEHARTGEGWRLRRRRIITDGFSPSSLLGGE